MAPAAFLPLGASVEMEGLRANCAATALERRNDCARMAERLRSFSRAKAFVSSCEGLRARLRRPSWRRAGRRRRNGRRRAGAAMAAWGVAVARAWARGWCRAGAWVVPRLRAVGKKKDSGGTRCVLSLSVVFDRRRGNPLSAGADHMTDYLRRPRALMMAR